MACGAPGRHVSAQTMRQAIDLEHWAAFRRSFEAVANVVIDLAAGRHGEPPTSIGFLSGDVHYSYLAHASLPPPATSQTRVYQAVCSPIRTRCPDRSGS